MSKHPEEILAFLAYVDWDHIFEIHRKTRKLQLNLIIEIFSKLNFWFLVKWNQRGKRQYVIFTRSYDLWKYFMFLREWWLESIIFFLKSLHIDGWSMNQVLFWTPVAQKFRKPRHWRVNEMWLRITSTVLFTKLHSAVIKDKVEIEFVGNTGNVTF